MDEDHGERANEEIEAESAEALERLRGPDDTVTVSVNCRTERGSEDLPASGDGNPLTEGSVRVELRGFRNVRAGSVGNALWLGGGGPGSDEITFISVAHGYIVRGERNKRHYRM